MSKDPDWDDEARSDLRELLRMIVLGEVRLARADRQGILETCREVYIEDECPEDEWDDFVHFAEEEIDRARSQIIEEQASWPIPTDCDRLDRAEAALRERGILLWQVSPCCDSCTSAELPDRIDEIEQLHPGFRERVRGYAFYIDQTLPESLGESSHISVYLAYGWFAPDGSEVSRAEYEMNALSIAGEVCDCIREAGLEPEWNGDFSRKIGVPLEWRRRIVVA